MRDHWKNGLFVGSGHAQSMLIHGQPLLASGEPGEPVELVPPLRTSGFEGTVALWGRFRPIRHLELRWRSSRASARVPYAALPQARNKLADAAWDVEHHRLDALHGEDYVDQHIDDPTALPTLHQDVVRLIIAYAARLAAMGISGAIEDLGFWRAASSPRGPALHWRGLGRRREEVLPLSVVVWAPDHVPHLLRGK